MKTFFFDGIKSVDIANMPEEAWIPYSGSTSNTAEILYTNTAFLYAVVTRIAQAVSSLPLTVDGEKMDDADNITGKSKKAYNSVQIKLRDLLYRWSLCNSLFAEGYATIERNGSKFIKRVRYINPRTISWELSRETGEIQYFRRRNFLASGSEFYYHYDPVQDKTTTFSQGSSYNRTQPGGIAWFWQPGLLEVGPGISQVMVAKNPANVLASIDQLAVNLFSRGAIDPFFITVPDAQEPSTEEANRLKNRLARLFRGLESAYDMAIVRKGIEIKPVTTHSPKNLALNELDIANQNDICAVYATPRPIVTGEMANRSVADRLTQNWYNGRVIPEAKMFLAALNHHIYNEVGVTLGIHYESLIINQEDEVARVGALQGLVSSGETLENAYQIFGYDLPKAVQDYYAQKKKETSVNANTDTKPAIDIKPIDSLLKIIEAFNKGEIDRNVAIAMVVTFLEKDPKTANGLIPQKPSTPKGDGSENGTA